MQQRSLSNCCTGTKLGKSIIKHRVSKRNPVIEMLPHLGILPPRQTPERCTFAHSFVYTKTPKKAKARLGSRAGAPDQLEAAIKRTGQGCQFPPSHEECKLAHLPTTAARLTLTERRHRLIRAPRLRLRVRDREPFILALGIPALDGRADALLALRHLRILHVVLLQQIVGHAALLALEVLGRHFHQLLGRDLAIEHPPAQLRVGFVLQVHVEGAHLGRVPRVRLGSQHGETRALDCHGHAQDV